MKNNLNKNDEDLTLKKKLTQTQFHSRTLEKVIFAFCLLKEHYFKIV